MFLELLPHRGVCRLRPLALHASPVGATIASKLTLPDTLYWSLTEIKLLIFIAVKKQLSALASHPAIIGREAGYT